MNSEPVRRLWGAGQARPTPQLGYWQRAANEPLHLTDPAYGYWVSNGQFAAIRHRSGFGCGGDKVQVDIQCQALAKELGEGLVNTDSGLQSWNTSQKAGLTRPFVIGPGPGAASGRPRSIPG